MAHSPETQCPGDMYITSETVVINSDFREAIHETIHDQPIIACLGESPVPVPVNHYAQCAIEHLKQNPPPVSPKQLIETSCQMCGRTVKARIGDRPADVSVSP